MGIRCGRLVLSSSVSCLGLVASSGYAQLSPPPVQSSQQRSVEAGSAPSIAEGQGEGVASQRAGPATDTSPQESGAGLGDIIVTAERRSTSLQKTPIAISVLGNEQIERQRIVDLKDIAAQAPGFTFSPNLKTQTTLSLRGAASLEDSPGTDQGVAIFVDEIYIGQVATFDFDLFNLERIEVLRGPQGTIFGKNVVGGALNMITRIPTNTPYVNAAVTYGNFGRLDGRVSVSGPLVDDKLVNRRGILTPDRRPTLTPL
ncbi:TonB-dependent receptor, partial [uncultured Sphingomonas sp.]|uniref:TonB-dependent receptor n=1 Tax=uncultured Sphingomonas sp. TaxID=158754 RepID=UPI0035C96333